MIERTDFSKKQFIFFFPSQGDKISFQNDNLVIKDSENKTKLQITCYRIFLLFIVGDTTITTGILSRANKFGFSICLMNRNMKMYQFISARMEGNTVLRKRQYLYDDLEIGKYIVKNKIQNQKCALMNIRNKNELIKEAIVILDEHVNKLEQSENNINVIMGIEGSAARTYFSQMFNITEWNGRKPRIKNDYVNASLDIGYTILFNIIDALLNVYGFDEYYGVLHKCFYMRKSLVCDLMEPMRPIIDYSIIKAINLKQIKKEHFKIYNSRYQLEWKNSPAYTQLFLNSILEYRDEIFLYIRDYYRAFMKEKSI